MTNNKQQTAMKLVGLRIGYSYDYFIDSNLFFEILVPSLKSYQIKGIKYQEDDKQ